jgi:K+-sensing histidine kinase KdpD
MGLLSILLGVALMGVLADVLVENDVATAATQSFQVAGTTQDLSMPVLIAIAFVMGALAIGLILAGIRSMRRGRRRMLKQRIRTLEDENARLHTQRNLQRIVRIPESEPAVDANRAQAQAPVPPSPAPAKAPAPPKDPSSGESASKW